MASTGRDRRRAAARRRWWPACARPAAALGDGRGGLLDARSSRATAGPKRACLEVALDGGAVRLAAQAKGAGHDLAALRDDVLLRPDGRRARRRDARPAHRRVREALVRPHRVDGQLSTSDTVVRAGERRLGRAGRARDRPTSSRLGEALDALLRQLALEIVADGEGARRVGRVVVTRRPDAVEPVARAVANSPLVKTALHGGDPNFGRILQAAGAGVAARRPVRRRTSRSRAIRWCPRASVGSTPTTCASSSSSSAATRSSTRSRSPARAARPRSSSRDLSPEYVNFNAEYTS